MVAGSVWIGFLLTKFKLPTSVENPVSANTTTNSSSLNQVELTTARNVTTASYGNTYSARIGGQLTEKSMHGC